MIESYEARENRYMTMYELNKNIIYYNKQLENSKKRYCEAVKNNWQFICAREIKKIERLKKHIEYLEERTKKLYIKLL